MGINVFTATVRRLQAEGMDNLDIMQLMLEALKEDGKPSIKTRVLEKDDEVVDEELKIRGVLTEFGFAKNLKGYRYLIVAIMLYRKDPDISLTTDLYPTVAKQFNTTSQRVERACRHSIGKAFETCPASIVKAYFGNSFESVPPTNSQFFAAVADIL